MLTLKKQRGDAGENSALHYLQQAGLTCTEKNYHCRYGEIDLIMQDQQTLVFVEVRVRGNQHFGGAAASVDRRKQQKIVRTAEYYLQRLPGNTPDCRIDVVAIDGEENVDWIKNAFGGNA